MSKGTKIEHAIQLARGEGRVLTILIFALPWLPSGFWMWIDLVFIAFFFWVMQTRIQYVMAWRGAREKLAGLHSLMDNEFRNDPLVEELKLLLNEADLWVADQVK